jgi:WD40 repeat protein
MWNFNNGQIIRRMYKNTAYETTDVLYIEMGASQYIVAVGWDRQVSIFLEDCDTSESGPIKVLDGNGTTSMPGHTDDISSVSFGEPNMLATSSIDGTIIIWNLESGYIKFVLREPNWELRSKEDRSVEKVLFVNNGVKLQGGICPLFSCHSDGSLHLWHPFDGKMLGMNFEVTKAEHNCQILNNEGLTSLSCDESGSFLLVGGSMGHVRVIDIRAILAGCNEMNCKSSNLQFTKCWRAHLTAISSAIFVEQHNMILTGSEDCTIRLWGKDGKFFISKYRLPRWSIRRSTLEFC